jgi:DNA processing protein
VEQDKRYWVALNLVPGIGAVVFRDLLRLFEDPREVFKASERDLGSVEGVGPQLIRAIRNFSLEKRLKQELNQIAKHGVSVLSYREPEYPRNLRAIYDPPPVLYVRGSLAVDDDLAVAIVGSRMATHHGKAVTERLARDLAVQGVTVVSGMARGIDAAAHRGALLGRGRTVAVLGCGVDVTYPSESHGLMREIVESGAVISEFPMGTRPHAFNFPRRNRIISGLSLGVIVAEATRQSGSLITANYALEQGREIFAVPGTVGFPTSQGTNRLIREGAKLVEKAEDILEEILPQWEGQKPTSRTWEDRPEPVLSEEEQLIYRLLGTEPVHIDRLITQTHWEAGRVSRVLMNLELAGLISQLAGKQFVRV